MTHTKEALERGSALIDRNTELFHAQERIAELEDALRPFADFNAQGAWLGTAWEHQPETAAVLHCHATKLEIKLEDFYRATRAMRGK